MRVDCEIGVTGIGMMTPVGLTTASTCAGLRAGITRTGEIATYLVAGEGMRKQPVIGGRVPTEWFDGEPVEEKWPGHERFGFPIPPSSWEYIDPGIDRLIQIAVRPARECWDAAAASDLPAESIGLYLAIGGDQEQDVLASEDLTDALQKELGVRFEQMGVVTDGRAGGLAALQVACRRIAEGKLKAALVGGVDSMLREPALRGMEEAGALRASDHPTGVIPGEAAAFVFVEAVDAARARGREASVSIAATSYRREKTAGTDEPNQGSALTLALAEARADVPDMTEHPLVVCDLNGDRYRASEWAFAMLRSLRLAGEPELWHPAEYIGDAGASMGLVNLAWAATALEKGYANKRHALIWGASDGPVRAAVVLEPSSESAA